jgi:branched-subunit amino acid transport protein
MSMWGNGDGWIAIAGLAIGTFLIRYSFIGLLAGKKLPPRFERALQLAVPAIFAALVVPLVIMVGSSANLDQRWPHLVAAIVTGIYAWWRGGMFVSLVVGMGTLHAILQLMKL